MGRRGVAFALGQARVICDSVRGCSSERYRQMLLRADAETAGWVMRIKTVLCERWTSVIMDKLRFWGHVPHKCLGGFGQYMGFAKSEAKRCIGECFHEWDGIRNKSEGHR
eukprot:8029849-Alexandrium_andersonii.AAC.1